MKLNKNLLIVLAAGAIILSAWTYYLSQANRSATTDPEREFAELTRQSSSDDTEEIEADLEETDFEDLDKELVDIETELNSTAEAKTQ